MEVSADIPNLITLIRDKGVKVFDDDAEICDIIRSFLDEKDSMSDHAFFIVDLTKIIEQHKKWVELLPEIVPFYAVKCNNNGVIISFLDKIGVNFDVASKGEIAQILDLKIDPSRMIYANPNRHESYIKYARSNDVDLLTFDSPTELLKIKIHHPQAELVVRIKVDDSNSECKFSCKFGASLEEVDELYELAKSLKLKVVGVAFHVGSNCRDTNSYRYAIKDARAAFDIGKKYGFNFTYLDIGGGLPGVVHEGQIPFEAYSKTIKDAVNEFFPTDYISRDKLRQISELGRYFVTSSHTLVLNVINKKEKVDKETGKKSFIYYLNDGIYGSFNNLMFDHANAKFIPYNERDGVLYDAIIYGPTCDSIDALTPVGGSNLTQLPDLAVGEVVYVENMGAYTVAAASTFNSFPYTKCKYIIRQQSL